MPRKTIHARSQMNDEPVELDIDGAVFQCQKNIPGVKLLDFMGSVDEEEPASMVKALMKLLDDVLMPEERARFKEYASDPNNGVSLDILSDAVGWLTEVYTSRPTTQSD